MHRLQGKCLFASVGFHLLLVLSLLSGAGFRAERHQTVVPGPLQIVTPPADAGPSAPAVADRETGPASTQTAQPDRAPPALKPDPASLEPARLDRPKLSPANLTRITRTPRTRIPARVGPTEDSAATLIDRAVTSLGRGLSPLTDIHTQFGGALDAAAQDYAQAVKDAYTQNWDPAGDGAAGDGALTRVTVTIASDGRVLSAKILNPSGDRRADQTVQEALRRVSLIRPFEPGAKDYQRTYTINFSLNARRLPD